MRQSHELIVDGQRQPYAKGVVAEGRFIFVSGVTGEGPTVGDQAVSCWEKIKERVESMGGKLENTVQRMTFVTDVVAWRADQGKQRAWLEKNCASLVSSPPSGTLIGCVALAQPEFLIEIQVVVVLD